MGKKEDILKGAAGILQERASKPSGKVVEPSSEREQKENAGTSRTPAKPAARVWANRKYTSLCIDQDAYEKLREIAHVNNLSLSDLVDAAIRKFVSLYEAQYGVVELSRESKISADSLV